MVRTDIFSIGLKLLIISSTCSFKKAKYYILSNESTLRLLKLHRFITYAAISIFCFPFSPMVRLDNVRLTSEPQFGAEFA